MLRRSQQMCVTNAEWHQFQGLNEVIYSQYVRQYFRACGGLRGNLITPSRMRPPVGARLPIFGKIKIRLQLESRMSTWYLRSASKD
jgi:hypothetical protein